MHTNYKTYIFINPLCPLLCKHVNVLSVKYKISEFSSLQRQTATIISHIFPLWKAKFHLNMAGFSVLKALAVTIHKSQALYKPSHVCLSLLSEVDTLFTHHFFLQHCPHPRCLSFLARCLPNCWNIWRPVLRNKCELSACLCVCLCNVTLDRWIKN